MSVFLIQALLKMQHGANNKRRRAYEQKVYVSNKVMNESETDCQVTKA